MPPTISVIMSVRNSKGSFLKQAIESILRQTFSDFEFLIIDDDAPGNIKNILAAYARQDPRITLLANSHNEGLACSLNRGIGVAKGQFIARMDDDDIALPDRLQQQLLFLRQHNYDLVASASSLIDETGQVLGTRSLPPLVSKKVLFKGNVFTHSTFFGRASIFRELYNPHFPYAQDYEFLLRVTAKKYRIGCQHAVTMQLRRHASSSSSRASYLQESLALRARWLALTRYHYGWHYFPYLVRSALLLLLPRFVKQPLADYLAP